MGKLDDMRRRRKDAGLKEVRPGVLGWVDRVKFFVVLVLLFLMLALVAVTTVELIIGFWDVLETSFRNVTTGDLLQSEDLLMTFFGFILTIFIAIELAESVEVYLTEHDFHAELVVLVALIAVARKIILLDYDKHDPITYLGIAAIVAALGWAYFMLRRSRRRDTATAIACELGEIPPDEAL
jgi:uncharacterized membrane protein (DUF373 family)